MTTPVFSTDPERLAQFSRDSVYKGAPESVCIARDGQEAREAMQYCHAKKIPVTFCGSMTSMTGASVADSGLALSVSRMNRILDIGTSPEGEPFVITEPGVILSDLKKAVEEEGFFYPPDPTSLNEAQVGATVVTNATGEDTYKYGPTRRYVDELDVILADGSTRTIRRKKPVPDSIVKNTAGYFLGGEEIDELIGSEGTLALVGGMRLRLLRPGHPHTFLLILPFSNLSKALEAVVAINRGEHRPRALELIGPGAAEIFCSHPSCPEQLKAENVFLYIKDEYDTEEYANESVFGWFGVLNTIYREVGDLACFDRIFLAKTGAQLKGIHDCRHHIPATVNEEYFKFSEAGGGKVGTDWWVPPDRLIPMMIETLKEAIALKLKFLVFAHIGNGHPHWNFLARDKEEHDRAVAFVKRQCRMAVQYGGGAAGEHGIGKIKRYLMDIQHSPDVIKQMIELKRKWDPEWILGRGNILNPCPPFSQKIEPLSP